MQWHGVLPRDSDVQRIIHIPSHIHIRLLIAIDLLYQKYRKKKLVNQFTKRLNIRFVLNDKTSWDHCSYTILCADEPEVHYNLCHNRTRSVKRQRMERILGGFRTISPVYLLNLLEAPRGYVLLNNRVTAWEQDIPLT